MKLHYVRQAAILLLAASSSVLAQAQDYQGYDQDQGYYEQDEYYGGGDDSLYHDYASRQEAKAQGGGG